MVHKRGRLSECNRLLFSLRGCWMGANQMNEELLAKCSCSQCGNHIEFPLEGTGALVACPHCGQQTQLTLEAPPARSDKPSAAELLAAFTGPVARTPASVFYQMGLVLV